MNKHSYLMAGLLIMSASASFAGEQDPNLATKSYFETAKAWISEKYNTVSTTTVACAKSSLSFATKMIDPRAHWNLCKELYAPTNEAGRLQILKDNKAPLATYALATLATVGYVFRNELKQGYEYTTEKVAELKAYLTAKLA